MIPVAFRQNDPRSGRVAIGETEVAITHEGTNTYYVVLRSDGVAGGALFIRARSGAQESEFSLQTR